MNFHSIIYERSEQAVWRGLWQAVDAGTRKALGISMRNVLDADCFMLKGVPAWLFNRVVGLGLEQAVTESAIDELIAIYHGENLPCGISLCPRTQPMEISNWLEARGFQIANQWVKMVRDASLPAHVKCDLTIQLATTKHAEDVGRITTQGFGASELMSPLFAASVNARNNRVYLAWDNQIPVAVGSLTLIDNIGHLNTAATLPEYRGRGAQGAIMARRIKDGIELGCKGFVTETWVPENEPNHSYNNMIRHGFELAYKRPNWVLEPRS